MAIPAMPPKSATEILDYVIDMTAELAGRANGSNDTITSVTFSTTGAVTPADLTVQSDTYDANTCTVWLMGGTLGQTYEVSALIGTAGGRTYHRSFKLSIKDR